MTDTSRRFPEPPRPQPTGRTLVMFKPGVDMRAAANDVQNATGVRALSSREVSGVSIESALSKGDAVYFERFKVCVMAPQPGAGERFAALAALASVQQTRPEFYMFAINDMQRRYNEWVRSGLQMLAEGMPQSLGTRPSVADAGVPAAAIADTDQLTWGLIAVGAQRSPFTGRGIRVAVLDTGIDGQHPDFIGRSIQPRSFVPGENVDDVQGHGTHTAGTVAGPALSNIGRRYGVAPDVDLHIGKVLNNAGTGREGDIIDGINWAIDQQCAVISMSLGRATAPGERPDPLYEEVGAAALREGSLIIAAAGNESARDFGFIAPVGAPANSPSIMAVAAVDPNMAVASFSCGGLNADGGEVNISGPGVSVYSSYPRPRLSRLLPGTSMACPHVAGAAALWAQSDPALRGQALWDRLIRTARELGSLRDFGRGLVQAPGAGLTS